MRIQASGDNQVVHSAIVIYQIAPTGTGNPTDSRMELQTMAAGALIPRLTIDELGNLVGSTGKALIIPIIKTLDENGLAIVDATGNIAIFIEEGGQIGIANVNPVAALDITGRVKIRGASGDTNWSQDGQFALKTTPGDGFLGITFHEADGTRIGVISAGTDAMSISAGEDGDSTVINIFTNDVHRAQIDGVGKVGIGGYDSLIARPVLGQFHIITDLYRTGFICVESPTNLIGSTPVVLIDVEDTGVGVNFVATGNVLIKSSDNVFAQGAFISVKNNTTQVITLDGSNSITFEVVNNSCQLTVYRSAGTKAYFVSFMGMYT